MGNRSIQDATTSQACPVVVPWSLTISDDVPPRPSMVTGPRMGAKVLAGLPILKLFVPAPPARVAAEPAFVARTVNVSLPSEPFRIRFDQGTTMTGMPFSKTEFPSMTNWSSPVVPPITALATVADPVNEAPGATETTVVGDNDPVTLRPPLSMAVFPVYLLAPDNVSVPLPILLRSSGPLITPLKVVELSSAPMASSV